MGPGSRLMVLAVAAACLLMGCGRGDRKRSLNEQAVGAAGRTPAPRATEAAVERKDPVVPPAVETEKDRALEWERREARMASIMLAEDVAELNRELREARERIARLETELGRARSELDRRVVEETARHPELDRPAPAADRGVTRGEIRLVDVNEDLSLVVLDAGERAGIRAGMQFGVTRQQKAIGRVRVVDVRDEIAGAVVEEVHDGLYPRKGDAVVLWSGN